jgi:hypothetical protein
MKKWTYNPFVYIAGGKALIIGLAVMILTATIAVFSQVHFDGAIDMHIGSPLSTPMAFLEPLVDWICLVLSLYIIGRIASDSSIRFIDVAGTLALARWPFMFNALLGFLPVPKFNLQTMDLHYIIAFITNPAVIALMVISLPLVILTIALMYNAFAVSANLKGGKSIGAFIGGLIVAEIISKVILHYMHNAF